MAQSQASSGTSQVRFSEISHQSPQPQPPSTMATPATGATAPLAPSLEHSHAHNIDRCDDPMQKNGSCQNSSSPISTSLLSGKIVANALRPFLGKANEYGAGDNSSATGCEGSTPIQDHSFPPRSGLDILNSLDIHDNAAARKLVELAEQQQREVGDGSTGDEGAGFVHTMFFR